MSFTAVYKLRHHSTAVDFDENAEFSYIEREEFDRAVRQPELYHILHFLRINNYQIKDEGRFFKGSIIEGPLEEEPRLPDLPPVDEPPVDKPPATKEYECYQRLVPARLVPDPRQYQWQQMELGKYGCTTELEKTISGPAGITVPEEVITASEEMDKSVDKSLLESLTTNAYTILERHGLKISSTEGDDKRPDENGAKGMLSFIDNTVTLLANDDSTVVCHTLGPRGSTKAIVQKLGLSELPRVIKNPAVRDYTLSETLREGIAYDFHPEKLFTKSPEEPEQFYWMRITEIFTRFLLNGEVENIML